MFNVYYDVDTDNSHDSGLRRIGLLDEEDLSYSFNTFLVVKHDPTGRLFWAQDSGCSCPTPFEDYSFEGPDNTNLHEITVGDSFLSFRREVEGFPVGQEVRENLIARVQQELKRAQGTTQDH